MTDTRSAVISQLAAAVCALHPGHPTRVAVDGITAAGKSTLVAELGDAVGRTGRPVVTLSLDGFHQPRAQRYRRGRRSAVGYYEDAYDVDGFLDRVLVPLGPNGDRLYRQRVHDLGTDRVVVEAPVEAPADAVVVVDGSFLLRPELSPHWDYRIHVTATPDVARARVVRRDAELLGGEKEAAALFDDRYEPAFRLYVESARPGEHADVIVANDVPARPIVEWKGVGGTGAR
jgi:uridine kinase